MPETALVYRPYGAARELFACRRPEVLLSGAAGTGKSRACIEKMHLAASKYPGSRWIMLRKTRVSLTQSGMITFERKVLHPLDGVRFHTTTQEYRYPNGSVVVVAGLDDPAKVLSAEYDCAYVQEATELTETDWETLSGRLRYGVMPYQQIIADCNPASNQHWLYKRAQTDALVMFHSRHEDNPELFDQATGELTPFGRDYIARLDNLTGFRKARLRYGQWVGAEGLVYDDFDGTTQAREVDCAGWRTRLGVDVGTRNPTAILLVRFHDAYAPHVEREVYRRNMTSGDIVDAIAAEADAHHPDSIEVDPSAASYIAELERRGYRVNKAINDRKHGIGAVHDAISRGLTVDPSCHNLLTEFGLYRYPDNKDASDDPIKEHDHALDALRYAIAREEVGQLRPMVW